MDASPFLNRYYIHIREEWLGKKILVVNLHTMPHNWNIKENKNYVIFFRTGIEKEVSNGDLHVYCPIYKSGYSLTN